MRRTVGALVLTISVLSVVAGPAAGSTAPIGAAGSGAGVLGLTPVGSPGLSVAIDPGRSASREVVVSNRSASLRLTVHLDPSGAAASWMTLSDVVETLEPHASARVSVEIQVPANAVPGELAGAVVASVEQTVRASDGSSVAEKSSPVSVPISVKVNGAPTAQVSVVGARAVEEQGHKYLEIQFQNVGATSMVMRGRVHVPGGHPAAYDVRANAAPLTTTIARIPWSPPSSGAVGISVDAGDARGDQATWSGSVAAASAPTTGATTPPTDVVQTAVGAGHVGEHGLSLVFLVIAIVIAALWLLYEVARARARKRARIRRLAAVVASIDTDAIAVAPLVSNGPAAAPATPLVSNGPAAASAAAASRPVVVSEEQVNAVAVQLAALVNAIDRLTDRLDSQGTPGAAPTRPAPRVTPRTPPVLRAVPVVVTPRPARAAEAGDEAETEPPVIAAAAGGETDPFDWPTEQQLERFAEGRRAARREFE